MYIDLDDVRDPETGAVSQEVAAIVEQLDSYTEASRSGTGLHILVYGELPEGIGKIDKDLHDIGGIEMYDHGRFFGATWDHVDGTPTEINERQDVVVELIEEYAADRLRDARISQQVRESSGGGTDGGPAPSTSSAGASSKSGSPSSPYWSVEITKFADPESMPKIDVRTNERQGAHPDHGKTTQGNESFNYNVDTGDNCWHCFPHESGGGPMEMAAIMAKRIECRWCREGILDTLSNAEFLDVCLYARDELDGFTEDMDPPYRALVAIAELFDMSMANPDRQILGRTTHRYARKIYDELDRDRIQGHLD